MYVYIYIAFLNDKQIGPPASSELNPDSGASQSCLIKNHGQTVAKGERITNIAPTSSPDFVNKAGVVVLNIAQQYVSTRPGAA